MSEVEDPVVQAKRLLREGRHAEALPLLDRLLQLRPDLAPLHWHRARCLEAMERYAEALTAVQQVLRLTPEYAPAWLKQAELAAVLEPEYPDYEADLRRALDCDPRLAGAHRALALHAWEREDFEAAWRLLDQALELDPQDAESWALRARWSANLSHELEPGEEGIRQFNGSLLSPAKLARAVAGFRRAAALAPTVHRYRIQLARHLHELRRFEDAMAEYDRVLAMMSAEHPLRELVVEMRERSAGAGAGEREAFAKLLDPGEPEATGDRRSAQDDMLQSVMHGLAEQLRQGADLSTLLDDLDDEGPDRLLALHIAEKLHRAGHEGEARLRPAPLGEFPPFMRRAAERSWRALQPLGFEHLGDFEPLHLGAVLTEKTLLRCYRSIDASICAASFAMRPAWPGWFVWLIAVMLRQYRIVRVIELQTAFDDGHHVVTSNSGTLDPLGVGPGIDRQCLPLGTAARKLFREHRRRCEAYRQQHPQVDFRPVRSMDTVIALQNELTERKNAWRQSVGYATDEELQQLLGRRQDLVPKVRAQLRRLSAAARQAAAADATSA